MYHKMSRMSSFSRSRGLRLALELGRDCSKSSICRSKHHARANMSIPQERERALGEQLGDPAVAHETQKRRGGPPVA